MTCAAVPTYSCDDDAPLSVGWVFFCCFAGRWESGGGKIEVACPMPSAAQLLRGCALRALI